MANAWSLSSDSLFFRCCNDLQSTNPAVSHLSGHSATATAPSALAIAQQMWTAEGFAPFHRGLLLTVARAAPVSAVVLSTYDVAFAWGMGYHLPVDNDVECYSTAVS